MIIQEPDGMRKTNYTKRLESSCDDSKFSSSKIILEYEKDNELDIISLRLDLQSYGDTAYLRKSEIEDLIRNLETFKDRLNG